MPITETSPAWKNPRDLMQCHLKRRSSSRRLLTATTPSPAEFCTESAPPLLLNSSSSLKGGRALNPFKRRSPVKKAKLTCVIERNEEDKENNIRLLDWNEEDSNAQSGFPLVSSSCSAISSSHSSVVLQKLGNLYPIDFSSLNASHLSSSSTPKFSRSLSSTPLQPITKRTNGRAPCDLRLGTHLRIITSKPFLWIEHPERQGNVPVHVKGADIEIGIRSFCSVLEKNGDEPIFSFSSPSVMSQLHSATLYWQFPDISWMRLFPRIDGSGPTRTATGSNRIEAVPSQMPSLIALGNAVVTALNQQWENSFEQLFNGWRSGERQSFYLCCAAFTVLFFRDKTDTLKAVITPTTRGLRDILRNEDVAFEMPLRPSSRRSSHEGLSRLSSEDSSCFEEVTQSQPASLHCSLPDNEEEIDSPENVNDEADSPNKLNSSNEAEHIEWMREIGISPQSTLKLRRHSSVSERSSGSGKSTELDETGSKSVVLVSEPAALRALFHLLITSRICRSTIGAQAGLPPTLISDRPFHNAALKCLSKTSQVIHKGNSGYQYVLDLDGGAILPHVAVKVGALLRSSDSSLSMQVRGRSSYPGMNEAIGGGYVDFGELEMTVEGQYTW